MAGNTLPRTYTEVAMLVAAKGVEALEGVPIDSTSKRARVRNAAQHLRGLGRADLADKLDEALASSGKGRGARLPALGETRCYGAQTSRGVDHVRVPTAPIGVSRPGSVRAAFFESRDKLGEWAEEHVGDRPFIVLVPEVSDG